MRSPAPSTGKHQRSEVVMLEVYLILAAFAAQILGMSVLFPVRVTRNIRTGLQKVPAERLAELYPGVDVGQAHERFIVDIARRTRSSWCSACCCWAGSSATCNARTGLK